MLPDSVAVVFTRTIFGKVGPNLAVIFCPRTKSGNNILFPIGPNLAARFDPWDKFWVGSFLP